jgi:hypothetical protein
MKPILILILALALSGCASYEDFHPYATTNAIVRPDGQPMPVPAYPTTAPFPASEPPSPGPAPSSRP